MTAKRIMLAWLVVAACATVCAAQVVTLDLAKQAAGSSLTVPETKPGQVSFRVINRLPEADYTYAVADRIADIPAFTAEQISKFAGPATDCASLVQKARALLTVKTEIGVGQEVDEIQKALSTGACTDAASLRDIQTYVARTTFDVPGTYTVGPGHEVTLTVSRDQDSKKLTWTLVVQGGDRGKWLTTYGATFVPNRDEQFFTQATATQGQFAIARQQRTSQVKTVPSVFFTWLPRSRQDKDWAWGPTAGLGVKNDRPAAFVGGTLIYNWNLGFVAGAAVVQESRLNGKYRETNPPQTISENLTDEQINVQGTYVRWFAGVTFRFGSNPFTEAAAGGTSAAAPKTTGGTSDDSTKKK